MYIMLKKYFCDGTLSLFKKKRWRERENQLCPISWACNAKLSVYDGNTGSSQP